MASTSKYLLIESRDPFESRDCAFLGELAAGLVRAGHAVTLFLNVFAYEGAVNLAFARQGDW